MSPIHYIPDNEHPNPIPIPSNDVWENDIRLDNYLKDRIPHLDIVDWGTITGGSSSSAGSIEETYYGRFYHPIANIEMVDPDPLFADDHTQVVYTDLPGKMGGPVMDDENYLTYPGAGSYIPGAPDSSSSST